jgi:hypothetical protein
MMEEQEAGGSDEDVDMAEAGHATSTSSFVVKFSEVYAELPSKLPEHVVDEVTVHLAFAGLLHLVNETGLKITPVGADCADFALSNGDE